MKKLLLPMLAFGLLFAGANTAFAGDCKTRDEVDWHATITSAVFVRSDCPEGDIVGTVPGGEVVRILEVDRYNEFYLVETSVGTGFLFASFLTDITESPLPGSEDEGEEDEPTLYPESIFIDLDPNHEYYDAIAEVKELGIVSGTPEGYILADDPVNRAELAKILVEAVADDETINSAILNDDLYSDVEVGAWYTPYLQLAHETSIITGDDNDGGPTTVRPGDNANGAEVAKMIATTFELYVPEPESWEEWYDPYLNALEEMDALPYDSPSQVVTRGEMMFMVSQIL